MSKRDITITTSDGKAAAGLFAPADRDGKGLPGVVLYMDAFGPRAALDSMGQRLADQGYLVLIPDLFYRFAPYGPFDAKTAFSNEETGKQIRAMMGETTQAKSIEDSAFYINALEEAGATGKMGVVGYCMGGARALNAAAAYPGRIAAAASFHGGNLAADNADSPHKKAKDIKAKVYVGMAGVDKSFPPEQSALLAQALREAEVDYVLENYVGCAHGWAVPDHGVFNEAGAERHWTRLTTLFSEALG